MTKNLINKSFESVLFMFGAMVISMFIGAASRFVLAAQLDASIFGNFTIAMAIAGFVMLFANTQGDRFIVVSKGDREKAVSTVFTTELIICFILVSGWFLLSPIFWNKIGGGMSWWFASLLLLQGFSYPLSRPRALLERDLNFKVISIVNVLSQAACAGTAITLAMRFKNELPLIIGAFVTLIQAVVFFKVSNCRIRLQIDPVLFREYMRLCLPLMASGLLVFCYWNGDKFLLDRYVSREQLGYYGWAFSLGVMVSRVKDVVARVLFPVFASLMRDGQEAHLRQGLSMLYRSMTLLYGLFVPALVVAAPSFVLLAGKEWSAAAACVQIAILIFATRTFNSFLEPIFVTHGKSHLLMYVAFFNALFILAGGWISLQWIARIETMASVVLLSCVFTFFICVKAIRWVCGVNLLRIIAPGVSASIFSGLVMFLWVRVFGEGLAVLILAVGIGLVVYVGCVWREGRTLLAAIRRQVKKAPSAV